MVCLVFFFFKQKTAYEMRISDWSSDVCSSDLRQPSCRDNWMAGSGSMKPMPSRPCPRDSAKARKTLIRSGFDRRSEEHTSELQSQMRISNAVFCLKKKKKQIKRHQNKNKYKNHKHSDDQKNNNKHAINKHE